MSIFNRFTNRGNTRVGDTAGKGSERIVDDKRKPIYLVLILDTSSSMDISSTIINEDGSAVSIKKIEQLNDGMKKVVKSLRNIEASSPLFKIYLQVIQLNSYGQALFPEFKPVSRGFEEIKFEADGCTCLGASLGTLKTYISHRYLRDERPEREGKGYNKAVSVILMSDGQPTDGNGVDQESPAYRKLIDEFRAYLATMDYARNVDMYSIAVGEDACEEMLKYFSDGDENLDDKSRFYRVDDCESIASKLDFVTRQSLAHHTTAPIQCEEDKYDDDVEEDELEGLDSGDEVVDDFEEDADEVDEEEECEDIEECDTAIVYEIDVLRCKKEKCLACIKRCPVGAIVVRSGAVVIEADKCTGCGNCESECPYEAIRESESDESLDAMFDDIES